MTNDLNQGDLEPVVDDTEDFADVEDHYLDDDDTQDEVEEATIDDESDDEEEPVEVEAEEAEAEEESDEDAVLVTLEGGEQVALEELKGGYLRQQDYTHKTEEIARQREEAETLQTRSQERWESAETMIQNLTGYIETIIPPEPDLVLASADPGQYTQMQAVRAKAIEEFKGLLNVNSAVKAQRTQMSEQDMAALKAKDDAALVKAMPHLSDPAKRSAFDKNIKKSAAEFGFSEAEIAQTSDPRILQLVHWARQGKLAEHNRKNAKRRVETPKTKKAPTKRASIEQMNNAKAMNRLSKSGSLEDALSIDFD